MARCAWNDFEAVKSVAGWPAPYMLPRGNLPHSRGAGRAWRHPIALIGPAGDLMALWCERARQRRALAQLDDRLLHDIGLTRNQAAGEAGKPFWR